MSGKILRERSKYFREMIDFKVSIGFLNKFRQRCGKVLNIFGGRRSVNEEVSDTCINAILKVIRPHDEFLRLLNWLIFQMITGHNFNFQRL